MNNELSKKLALEFISATTSDDLKKIFTSSEGKELFDNPKNWVPYGGEEGNWGTISSQQSKPVGAFVELLMNSIDAVLLRKAKEAGITDPRSPSAPQTMQEAVKKFFPRVNEGKIAKLSNQQRRDLAKQVVQVAIKPGASSKNYPTYTIVDAGEGQLPENFPNTLVSLSKNNKNGINFVQGKFNMGSTGAIRFCTRGDIDRGLIKLIVSKRAGQDRWGWTIVRVREPREDESKNVVEYFCPYKKIPEFKLDQISAFGHDEIGTTKEGTIIKLYEYDMGPGARAGERGLRNALGTNLIDCCLPIYICDFNIVAPRNDKGALRKQGISDSVFSGLNIALNDDVTEELSEEKLPLEISPTNYKTEFVNLIEDINHEELGQIKIYATGISKMPDYLEKEKLRVFYTLNGQAQSAERASFLNQSVGLPELQNHLIVNVMLEGLTKKARNAIFFGDRERMSPVGMAGVLRSLVVDALKNDSTLREYARTIRLRRATEQVEDKAETRDLLKDMISTDPALKELFGAGTFFTEIDKGPGDEKVFTGEKYPTFLKPKNLSQINGVECKEVPINTTRKIECLTDAEDEYLSRIDSPGEKWCSLGASEFPYSAKLKNGIARFTITPPSSAKVGDEIDIEIGFKDYGRNLEPLFFKVRIIYTKPEKKKQGPPNPPPDDQDDKKKKVVGEPDFKWVSEEQWGDHGFDEESGAYVSKGEETVVYINRANKYLKSILGSQKDEAIRKVDENIFKIGLGLFAIAIDRKISKLYSDGEKDKLVEDTDEFTKTATSSISPYIITVVKKLGAKNLKWD